MKRSELLCERKNGIFVSMNKKDFIRAFFAGVFSITPFVHVFPSFKAINVDDSLIKRVKCNYKPINVNLRPVIEDVGSCFDDVGNKLFDAMDKVSK